MQSESIVTTHRLLSRESTPTTEVTMHRKCQVCRAELPEQVLDLGLQPLCDDLVPVGSQRQTKSYPIQIAICSECLTAHQVFQIPKETLFPKNYHYRPRFTQDVLAGMQQLVDECREKFVDLTGKLVCDVGCNDGSLLTLFRAQGAKTCGIEPTGAATEAAACGHQIVCDYFTPATAERLVRQVGKPDVITFTNVFAHIEDLEDAIAAIKIMVHSGTLVIIENHYLGTVLNTCQFDTFYHEHPRTYSLRSFEFIVRDLEGELLLVSFPKRYGGNIRVYIGNFKGPKSHARPIGAVPTSRHEGAFPSELARVQHFVNAWKNETRAQILKLLGDGDERLYGKSFPGRASILVNLLGLTAEEQPYVFEQPGSPKVGHYVPGTRIEIVSDERWMSKADQPTTMLIWGWHIGKELCDYLRKNSYKGRIFTPLPRFVELDN